MVPTSAFNRALNEAAPSLSRRFFACSSRSSCRLWSKKTHADWTTLETAPAKTIRVLQARAYCTRPRTILPSTESPTHILRPDTAARTKWTRKFSGSTRPRAELTTEALAHTDNSGHRTGSSFPKTSTNTVAYWLLGSAASVFGIVVFGGLTRLTESGLSITEWKPVTGSVPPRSQEEWEVEFAKYRSSPEFKILNSRMTLEEFKSIYWMEWIHRLWGRVVGLSFVLPAVYFVARKQVSKRMAWNLLGISGLIGFQGFIGWWMVKSGLKDDLFASGSQPRVSQYRLTAHLGTAFVCYLAMLWNGLDILRTNKLLSQPWEKTSSLMERLRLPALKPFKTSVAALAALVFVTAMSGGLVAGLDAGLIYNEFPYMGLGLTPPKSELFDKFYSHREDAGDLVWRNFLENPSLVQLDHRILATTTFSSVMALWAWTNFSKELRQALPRSAKKGVHGVVGFVFLQVTLGITTLLYLVPTGLASAHQAGSLALLTWTMVLGSRVWMPSAAVLKIVSKRVKATEVSKLKKHPSAGIESFKKTALPHQKEAPQAVGSLAAGGLGLAPLGLFCASTSEKKTGLDGQAKDQMNFLQRQSGKVGTSV